MENMENDEKSGITRIRVKNFRSIADSSLELGPTTVMVGPNGSGKSNFLDAVAFLSDALRTNLDTAFSARQGFEAVRMREGEPGGVETEDDIAHTLDAYEQALGEIRALGLV